MFTLLRRISQVLFLGLFFFLVYVTTTSLIRDYPVGWFLGFDPLVAVTTALASHTLTHVCLWAIPLIVLSIVFGRFFCGWICPMGSLHHFLTFVSRPKKVREKVQKNTPRGLYRTKYLILVFMLGMAFRYSTQIGLLDPIASTWRAFATTLFPAAHNFLWGVYAGKRYFQWNAVIVLLFLGALFLNFILPRLYCRMLCPLGALLGLLSKFSLFRLSRDPSHCKECDLCAVDCQGAAGPQEQLRVTECMLCLNCMKRCPRGGITYSFLPSPDLVTEKIDLDRRRWITSFASGILGVLLLRSAASGSSRINPWRIRPPGALPEKDFLAKCLKCGVCMKVCPTNGLQPALTEAGLEGLWTPVLVPRLGHCEQECVLCGRVCPTSAIQKLSVAQKTGRGPYKEPVRIGTAFIDRGRCLPWAMDIPCIICEEVCPTSPKAVYYKLVTVTTRDGATRTLKQPHVDPSRCIGCGICEALCAVFDKAAIRVTSVGETRNRMNQLVIRRGDV